MVTLKEWFESKDYGIGLALLAKNSRNRVLIQGLSRKNNPDKLEYMLRKEAILQGVIIEEMIPKLPEPKLQTELMESHSDQVIDQMNAGNIVDLVKEGWTHVLNPDDLPVSLRHRWQENTDFYKQIRSLHEKLKLMENATEADRMPLVKRISDMDDKIRTNWEVIDAYQPGQDLVVEPVKTVEINHKRINANRKFISTNLKSLGNEKNAVKLELTKIKLQQRYDELKSVGEDLDPDTIDKLSKSGIKC